MKEQTIYLKGKLYRIGNRNSAASPRVPRVSWHSANGLSPWNCPFWQPDTTDIFLCLGEEVSNNEEKLYVKFLHVKSMRFAWVKIEYQSRKPQLVNRKFRLVAVR